MKEFVTSDLHFGHKNIIEYENRPYKDVTEMDCDIIKKWNEQVSDEDLVYILGDFSFYRGNGTNNILKMLRGRKILIIGNHDNKFLKDKDFDKSLFEEITHYKEIEKRKTRIVMSHYPLADWNGRHVGAIHLYGHLHTIENEARRYMKILLLSGSNCFNVCWDIHRKPLDIEGLYEQTI